ncbi:putative cell wall organization and biogenesis-related protein [Kockovaella imperatae]|uniref:Putative cell wall organization and biogenesis-related protein n=1 Tax=Kockovaella imperatae TaxID=4999 RepID=A0A1Y1UCD4_9TREE|nr:putative cell wall organization and biogenesis-related protein [Kockovaella imperatae]ORX35156.1 putative cell wall organization and biogenesis-related protein [Kockovaella imperatae]
MPRTRLPLVLLGLSAIVPLTLAQTYCNATSLCPESAPCCSEYGYCGSGTFCLGGCEPMHSFSPTSCRPNPICQSMTTTFANDVSRIQQVASEWNGNASAYDWYVNSGQIIPSSDGIKLVLNETNGGTKISSTRYVHYGKIDFVLETSKWPGVVTAAITMSDVKDEIDWEFTGSNTTLAQTNYWFMGIANYSDSQGLSVDVSSDTSANYHTYTFDWQEDYLNWMIDGNVVRSLQKQSTLSSDGTTYKYPTTPSQIQISIWPAGINTSAEGTIAWAGGMINWQDPDYVANGYFWNTIQSVTITCADDPNQASNTTGWAYSDSKGQTVPTVYDTTASLLINGGGRTTMSWTMYAVGVFTILMTMLL